MKPSILSVLTLLLATQALAEDVFLTIGGGYSREGNQASLEANVKFVQDILQEEYAEPPDHRIFFADGDDKKADLQVAAKRSTMTADRLISSLHSTRPRFSGYSVFYRNHQVKDIAGATTPQNIENGIRELAGELESGDRLFVYVTAHGGSAKKGNDTDPYNTTINCWGKKSITAQQLSGWLDEVPEDVPVIMVMAQCYCGGFAHTIFDQASRSNGLSARLRTGFFAQQHNLPAAGCRPDIDNDEEYSSFFWGALIGRSRNGKSIGIVDLNRDGIVSFAEAHCYAVLASNTIDIPLRASEALLRVYAAPQAEGSESTESAKPATTEQLLDLLREDTGTIAELVANARTDTRELVNSLTERLGISMKSGVNEAVQAWGERNAEFRSARRSAYRGRMRREIPGRAELKEELFIVWPELEDEKNWRKSELLSKENRAGLMEDIKTLPSYAKYEQSIEKIKEASNVSADAELSQIKFRRLVETLLSVSLANRLQEVASDEVITRYEQMIRLEESGLGFPN